jgi:hypothetical protein
MHIGVGVEIEFDDDVMSEQESRNVIHVVQARTLPAS